MANADSKTSIITLGPEALVTIKLGELEALRNALRGLLREVEYAVQIDAIPISWTDWVPPDLALENARNMVKSFK